MKLFYEINPQIFTIRDAYRSFIRAKTRDADPVVTRFDNSFIAVGDVHMLYASYKRNG